MTIFPMVHNYECNPQIFVNNVNAILEGSFIIIYDVNEVSRHAFHQLANVCYI